MLRDIPNKREVWAWGMYDLANQSFQLLINTLLFSLFFVTVVVGDEKRGTSLWSAMTAASLLLVIILSPILGALADDRAWKRQLLLGTGLICSALTAALALLQPNNIALAFALYVTAAVACGLGENFLASFLPQISTPKNVGLVSATGWAMSYAGALILLGITAAYTLLAHRSEPAQMRPLFVFAGLWFFAGMIPAALYLKERAGASIQPSPSRRAASGAFHRLAATLRQLPRYRELAKFLGVFFIYSMGTYIVIYFLGLIGSSLGFELPQLILFALVVAATAGGGAVLTAKFQDKLGHRRTISFFLTIWIVSALALAIVSSQGSTTSPPDSIPAAPLADASAPIGATPTLPTAPEAPNIPSWIFWTVAGCIGLALGGIGTSSRALVGLFTPPDRAAEFFGLWGMTAKLSAIVGVLAFGQLGMNKGLFATAAFFIAGLILMRFVDEKAGAAAAATTSPVTAEPTTSGRVVVVPPPQLPPPPAPMPPP